MIKRFVILLTLLACGPAWAAFGETDFACSSTTVDGEPTGDLTITAGDNRKLVLFTTSEDSGGAYSVTTMTVGGQNATTALTHGTSSQFLKVWLWDETAIDAMSGATVAYTDSIAVDNIGWCYWVIADTDQTAHTFADTEVGDDPTLTTGGTASDLVYVIAADGDAGNETTAYDGLAERWQRLDTPFAGSAASGAGGGSPYTMMCTASNAQHAHAGLVFTPVAANDDAAVIRRRN